MIQVKPSFAEFKKLARKGNLVPLVVESVADTLTPVALVSAGWNRSPYCFLLESVEGGEKLGRFSIVSLSPDAVIEERNGVTAFHTPKGDVIGTEPTPALESLSRVFRQVKAADVPGLPRFYGGAVGYLSYETIHNIERLPRSKPDGLKWPAASFLVGGDLFVFDNSQQLLKLITCVRIEKGASLRSLYNAGCRRLEKNLRWLRRLPRPPASRAPKKTETFSSTMSRAGYVSAVRKAKEHIAAGDIIQVVLARRQEKRTGASPLDIYRSLRVVNPSPYMFLVKFRDRALIGSSPESLVRLEGGVAMTRPIAGTRARGGTPQEDARLAKELLADPKERAEHLMLVDLGRNDLGRVCRYGSVHVPKFMAIERYSHVMHIVSEVNGLIAPDKDAFDLLRSAFPAGTVAGAPKIRAMEIIDDLEVQQRGPYAGAVGYFSYSGNMDMAITIRTAAWDSGRVSIQTGAGIVADSDPAKEWTETENKADGVKKAVELAESGRLFGERV